MSLLILASILAFFLKMYLHLSVMPRIEAIIMTSPSPIMAIAPKTFFLLGVMVLDTSCTLFFCILDFCEVHIDMN